MTFAEEAIPDAGYGDDLCSKEMFRDILLNNKRIIDDSQERFSGGSLEHTVNGIRIRTSEDCRYQIGSLKGNYKLSFKFKCMNGILPVQLFFSVRDDFWFELKLGIGEGEVRLFEKDNGVVDLPEQSYILPPCSVILFDVQKIF